MDAHYIVNRLKLSPYKSFTVKILKQRMENLADAHRNAICSDLKIESHKHNNFSIHEYLQELLHHKRMAA